MKVQVKLTYLIVKCFTDTLNVSATYIHPRRRFPLVGVSKDTPLVKEILPPQYFMKGGMYYVIK